jgi:hypothetical protein
MTEPSTDESTPKRELTEAERNLAAAESIPQYKFVFTGGPCGG